MEEMIFPAVLCKHRKVPRRLNSYTSRSATPDQIPLFHSSPYSTKSNTGCFWVASSTSMHLFSPPPIGHAHVPEQACQLIPCHKQERQIRDGSEFMARPIDTHDTTATAQRSIITAAPPRILALSSALFLQLSQYPYSQPTSPHLRPTTDRSLRKHVRLATFYLW